MVAELDAQHHALSAAPLSSTAIATTSIATTSLTASRASAAAPLVAHAPSRQAEINRLLDQQAGPEWELKQGWPPADKAAGSPVSEQVSEQGAEQG